MTHIADNDQFIGTWQLQPELSVYEFGDPPAEGLYTIRAGNDTYLFEIAWETAANQSFFQPPSPAFRMESNTPMKIRG